MKSENNKIIISFFLLGLGFFAILGLSKNIETFGIGTQNSAGLNFAVPFDSSSDSNGLNFEQGFEENNNIPDADFDTASTQEKADTVIGNSETLLPKEDALKNLQIQDGYQPITGDALKDVANQDGLGPLLNQIFLWGIAGTVLLSVLFIVIGAIQYMTTDAVFSKSEGKEKILSAIGGLILALSSYLILSTINPQIVSNLDLKIGENLDIENTGPSVNVGQNTFNGTENPASKATDACLHENGTLIMVLESMNACIAIKTDSGKNTPRNNSNDSYSCEPGPCDSNKTISGSVDLTGKTQPKTTSSRSDADADVRNVDPDGNKKTFRPQNKRN